VALAVAAAYDAHEDRGIAGRKASSILHLKNFNNWVKATLIAEYAPRPARRVLDLACGKLGDIQKWRLAGVERYCGVDISGTGIRDGRVRFNTTNARAGAMAAKLVRADLGATLLRGSGVLAPGEAFDVISIQFALHYLFQTEHRALTFFRNVADALAPGGVFLGTIPDAAYLIRRLRDLPRGQLKFGNSLYYVAFDPATAARQYAIGDAPYGLSYDFFLAESVEHVKEYVVPWPLLTRLAAAAGLEPLANDNFHAFYERMRGDPRHATALQSMKVMDCEGTISEEVRERQRGAAGGQRQVEGQRERERERERQRGRSKRDKEEG
jgi:mRNA (guanine-N7-)-methyltransferase